MATQTRTENKEGIQTIEELEKSVKITLHKEINQIDVNIGNFRLTLSSDSLEWYSLDLNKMPFHTIYGQMKYDHVSINTFADGKMTTSGKVGELRHIRFETKRKNAKKEV